MAFGEQESNSFLSKVLSVGPTLPSTWSYEVKRVRTYWQDSHNSSNPHCLHSVLGEAQKCPSVPFSTAQVRPTSEKSLPVRTLTAQLQRSATFQGSCGQALRAELPSVTFIALGHWLRLQFDFSGHRGLFMTPRLGAPTTWRGFLRSFPILRQEGGCSGHSGLPFFSLRGGMAIKAARRRWMTYPCSLSGRAGVRLQGSPVPSLGLFSRRQTGSSRTPRALWLELVWIPGL